MTRHGHRIATLAGLLALVAAAGCKLELDPAPPIVGPPVGSRPPPSGLVVSLEAAGVADGRVWIELVVTKDDLPLDGAALAALRPAFTLAGLAVEPVSRLPAWRSYLPLGPQRIARLPVAGPGTPEAEVLIDVRQPGAEEGPCEDLGGGRFRYAFETALPAGIPPGETLRAGVFMRAVSGSPRATATIDFVGAGGGSPVGRELVVDAACATCHDVPSAHGGTRMGARICVTCHTYQHADPDTMDPAALATATRATDPNPLEFGRLVHRLHRGRNLPTLFRASSSVTPAPALPSATPLPLPFLASRNALELGKRFSVVGEEGHERVFGEVRSRTDGGAAARTVGSGVFFPRDYRDCAVCHANAAQAPVALYQEISRRSCAGCHPDVWFGTEALDTVHLAHPGGPQADDARCRDCHVAATATSKLYAPLDAVHVLPLDRVRANLPRLEIVSVRDLRPGAKPTVRFKVYDRNGTVTPLASPSPATDQFPDPSPVPRAFPPNATTGLSAIALTLGGPVAGGGREYATGTWSGLSLPFSESVPAAAEADAGGVFTYTFSNALPAAAAGTWTVTLSGRRSTTTVHYDVANDRFNWPYTGESVTETADQANVHVDVVGGAWDAPADPAAAPALRAGRPLVVSTARCNACHGRLTFHGSRNTVESCLTCHSPQRTDWRSRPKDTAGNVVVASTYDGIEERSTHFKVMIHRIHTGGRTGPASLTLLEPYVVYAGSATNPRPYFFDEGGFPADLANCERCHLPGTWLPENVPSDAGWTFANESRTVRHEAVFGHPEEEAGVPPLKAACTGCHATAYSEYHIDRYTLNGVETCTGCHGANASSGTGKVHGLR